MDITERQKEILCEIIEDYAETAAPVGSATLAKLFGVSSATIRAEMAKLEALGLIAQPHTSAGRVPTDAGYRFYVNSLNDINTDEFDETSSEFGQGQDYEEVEGVEKTASAEKATNRTNTTNATNATNAKGTKSSNIDINIDIETLRKEMLRDWGNEFSVLGGKPDPEFDLPRMLGDAQRGAGVPWTDDGRQAAKRAYRVADDAHQTMKDTPRMMGDTLHGETKTPHWADEESVRSIRRGEHALEVRIASQSRADTAIKSAVDALVELTGNMGLATIGDHLYLSGIAQLFSQPEFFDPERVQEVAKLVDNLEPWLREAAPGEPLSIFIGHENPVGKSSDVSLAIAKFHSPFSDRSYIGLLGPTRQNYRKIMSLVRAAGVLLERDIAS